MRSFIHLQVFPLEVPIFLREYGSGLYGVGIYYMSKTLVEVKTFFICFCTRTWIRTPPQPTGSSVEHSFPAASPAVPNDVVLSEHNSRTNKLYYFSFHSISSFLSYSCPSSTGWVVSQFNWSLLVPFSGNFNSFEL